MNKMPLTALVREHLLVAEGASSGRSSHTVYGGHEHVLRQTLIALAAGQSLEEHANPGEATVHVLHGHVKLASGVNTWEGSPGGPAHGPRRTALPRSHQGLRRPPDCRPPPELTADRSAGNAGNLDDAHEEELASTCAALFDARAEEAASLGRPTRAWPPLVAAHPHWQVDYERVAGESSVTLSLTEAVTEINAWITSLVSARATIAQPPTSPG